MQLNWLDRIGDWNPQLFRELKGRLNLRNVAIALVMSVVCQMLFFLSWSGRVPSENIHISDPYCKVQATYFSYQQQDQKLQAQYRQLQNQFNHYTTPQHYNPEKIQQLKQEIEVHKGKVKDIQLKYNGNCPKDEINVEKWWKDHYAQMFTGLCVMLTFALLVVGCYMLISDLAGEERRGTLNFIRLSPQSSQSILSGKILGVPALLYLAAALTIPFQLWLGFLAEIPLGEVISFWVVLIGSCAFFYSAAVLLGLVSYWFSGFQSWFGAGAVLAFLSFTNYKSIAYSPNDWLNLFSPVVLLPYLVDRTGSPYTQLPFSQGVIQDWQWFYFPLGASGISVIIFALLNYGVGTYWIWQALNQRFRNPSTTMLSKRQSYFLSASFAVVTLGFAVQSTGKQHTPSLFDNFITLLSMNWLLLVGLIAALSPHRQALQDWARYRREQTSGRKGFWKSSLVQDLIVGEKSPAVVAIAINLAIIAAPVALCSLILFIGSDRSSKLQLLSGLVLNLTFILICAALTQLMLLLKTDKRAIWASGTVVGMTLVLPALLGLLSIHPGENGGGLWLFTSAPWDALRHASTTLIAQVLVVQWCILSLLSWRLTRQLQQAGESSTKALFAARPSV